MTDSPVIEVRDLRKTYRDGLIFSRRIEALRGVTLQVPRGEIFGLLGPNGAGKTTLIKILLGVVRKTDGDAFLLGQPAGNRAARSRVGYLPESHRIPRHLTANTALEYYGGLSNMPMSQIRERRPELLDLVGLGKWGKTSVRKFSKGMQQRLGLAQAMLHDPDLLVLDEPTDGVDPVGRTEIRKVLGLLKEQQKTVFLNSHLLQELELVCDRVAILDRGRVRRVGNVSELRDESTRRSHTELAFHLQGTEAAIRSALGGRESNVWKRTGENRFEIALPLLEQPEIDRCVDALRGAGVSIVTMSRRQATLEDAFLEIVQEQDETA